MAASGAIASVAGNLLTKENSGGGGGTGLQKVINPFAFGNKDISGKERVQRIFDPFGLFGGGSSSGEGGDLSSISSLINIPDFERDSLFDPSQEYLDKYSTGLLEGNIPEYYSILGEYGGKEFQDLLEMTNRNVARSVGDMYAKSGGSRAGAAGQVTAEAVADASTKLGYQDYLSAKEGRMSLLNTGMAGKSGVRDASLNITNLLNNFALNKSKLELAGIQAAMGQADAEGGFFSDILGSVGSIAGLAKGVGGLFGGSGSGGGTSGGSYYSPSTFDYSAPVNYSSEVGSIAGSSDSLWGIY